MRGKGKVDIQRIQLSFFTSLAVAITAWQERDRQMENALGARCGTAQSLNHIFSDSISNSKTNGCLFSIW